MTEPTHGHLRKEHSTRVRAPQRVVWDEMETIDQILADIDEVIHSAVDDHRINATIRARLKWGPFGWNLNGVARLEDISPLKHSTFVFEIPNLGLTQHGRFGLVPLSADETTLTLVSDADLGRLAGKGRNVIDEGFEGYVRTLVTRIAARAERHWLAEQRLQQRFPNAEPC